MVSLHGMPGLRTTGDIWFADPYKRCPASGCNVWIDGVRRAPASQRGLIPCGHKEAVRDLCTSWSPVDGCKCPEGTHAMRPRPATDDGKVY